ncbi:MAG: site-specific integrase [Gammaproteobacteria bacterium]|nr:site-specific integrase [Gammaproteobacteria bacterium]
MKGHIRKRGKKWCFIIDLGHDLNGKRDQKWYSGFRTKNEAEKKLVEVIHELNTGAYIEPSKISVAEFLDKWLNVIRGNVARKTWERYAEICKHHINPYIGHLSLNKLQPAHISDLYSRLLESGRKDGKGGLSKRSVLHVHRVFREAMHQAIRWRVRGHNPCDAVDPPRPAKTERLTFTTEETLSLLVRAKGSRTYLPILIAVTTGMRRSEIIGLRWKDIDLDKGRLSIRQSAEQTKAHGIQFKEPKTSKSQRMISLPMITIDGFSQHRIEQAKIFLQTGKRLSADGLVFDSPIGLYTPDQLTSEYRRFVKKHGFKHVTFHDLRHTHATHLLEQNIHPKIVSERLGHSTIALTLDTYSHILPNMQDCVAIVTDKLFNGVQ